MIFETDRQVIHIQAYKEQEHRLRVWAIFSKTSDHLVGVCEAIHLSDQGRDIGYRILRKYSGQGLATEVANGLIDYIYVQTAQLNT